MQAGWGGSHDMAIALWNSLELHHAYQCKTCMRVGILTFHQEGGADEVTAPRDLISS